MKFESIFITVSFNNTEITHRYIKSWQKLNGYENSILIVVDNSSKEDLILKKIIENRTNVYYIRQNDNLGYMAGCNFGMEYAKKNGFSSQSIIYTNNDITFESADFIRQVNMKFESDSSLAVIAPSIWDVTERKELNPFMLTRPSLKRFKLMKSIYRFYLLAKIVDFISKKRPRKIKLLPSPDTSIYAPHGSIFILKSDCFYDNQPDDLYFLYGEEITIAEQCIDMNKEIKVMPSIVIHHHSHASTGNSLSYFIYSSKKNAINYIIKKYKWY